MESVQNIYAVASTLTDDPREHRDLVVSIIHHLLLVSQSVAPAEISVGEFVVRPVMQRLAPRQQEVWNTLLTGIGVRSAARQLGVSHTAVIHHRHKILRRLRDLVAATEPQPLEAS